MKTPFDIYRDFERPMSRRAALRAAGAGFGFIGLAGALAQAATPDLAAVANPMAPRLPQFAAKAKRVIYLFMHGGPSSVDTFDPKERLDRDHGKPLPFKRPLAFSGADAGPLMRSPWT